MTKTHLKQALEATEEQEQATCEHVWTTLGATSTGTVIRECEICHDIVEEDFER